jgi:flagellar biogenesis protein FliO
VKIHYVPTLLLLGSALLLLVVAAVLFLKGFAQRRAAEEFRGRAVETSATVVSVEAKDVSLRAEPDTRYFAVVRFVPDGAEEPIEATTLTALPFPPPRVDEEVLVAYDPQRPGRVDVAATEATASGAGRTWFLMGSLVLLVALGVAAAWLVLVFVVWTS